MKSLELIHSLELKFLMIHMKLNPQLLEKSIKLKKLKLLMIKLLILKPKRFDFDEPHALHGFDNYDQAHWRFAAKKRLLKAKRLVKQR